jgi:hypothetical protein
MLFKKVENADSGHLDLKLKNVFWAIDGIRTAGEIAQEGMYDLSDLSDLIHKLVKLNLIVSVEDRNSADQSIFPFLSQLLSDQMGPIGDIVLDDTVSGFGFSRANFPSQQITALIDSLAMEIGDMEKGRQFKKDVLKKLKLGG